LIIQQITGEEKTTFACQLLEYGSSTRDQELKTQDTHHNWQLHVLINWYCWSNIRYNSVQIYKSSSWLKSVTKQKSNLLGSQEPFSILLLLVDTQSDQSTRESLQLYSSLITELQLWPWLWLYFAGLFLLEANHIFCNRLSFIGAKLCYIWGNEYMQICDHLNSHRFSLRGMKDSSSKLLKIRITQVEILVTENLFWPRLWKGAGLRS
jgi:hypothetical protein